MTKIENNDNISFFLEEKKEVTTNESDIKKMLEDLESLQNQELESSEFDSWIKNTEFNLNTINYEEDLNYILTKSAYGNDELYYNEEYTIKDLLKICNYYDIDKNIKSSKCKKQDIIATIIYFESLPENFEIVKKRNTMWAYITELLNDPKMKKFIIF